jgi:hypothetical protein
MLSEATMFPKVMNYVGNKTRREQLKPFSILKVFSMMELEEQKQRNCFLFCCCFGNFY